MTENTVSYSTYQKKIVPYLDGSLPAPEAAEFEAFVLTHPDFESQIRAKREEIELIRSMIPVAILSHEASESVENEIRASVFNLLKEEPRNFWELIRIKWEEWINR